MSSEYVASFVRSFILPSHTTDTIFGQGCEHTHMYKRAHARKHTHTPESQALKLLTTKHLERHET